MLREPLAASKQELGQRLTLVTALFGLMIVVALTCWQLRPRLVETALGPAPLGFGDPASPKQVVAFLSPTCPQCAEFELTSGKDLYSRAEAGEFYYAVYPLRLEAGREAYTLGFFCAHEQGELPTYALLHYQNYYLNQNLGLRDVARLADINPAVFSRCLDAPTTQQAMQATLHWQKVLGVASTPTFFIKDSGTSYRLVRGDRGADFWQRWLATDQVTTGGD